MLNEEAGNPAGELSSDIVHGTPDDGCETRIKRAAEKIVSLHTRLGANCKIGDLVEHGLLGKELGIKITADESEDDQNIIDVWFTPVREWKEEEYKAIQTLGLKPPEMDELRAVISAYVAKTASQAKAGKSEPGVRQALPPGRHGGYRVLDL